MSYEDAKALFGNNFIGREQVNVLLSTMNEAPLPDDYMPVIPYSDALLKEKAASHLLILGFPGHKDKPLDILKFRSVFGTDPDKFEPCLYNQDWYLNEAFVRSTLAPTWYLIKKEVFEDSRAVAPEVLLEGDIHFPSAILCVYTFFAFRLSCGDNLWYHDFVWCSDLDHNGDRIYVGKYHDIDGINKNGFSIHRHLALRPCYASITTL